jgi:AbrB family looped-hinge helix DNA binding protein
MATERASLVKVSREGRVTLPKEVREGLAEDAVLEVVRREDGVIELRPKDIDPDQAWFWTERWQQMEREADEDYAAGRYKTFDSADEFLADLDRESTETDESPG